MTCFTMKPHYEFDFDIRVGSRYHDWYVVDKFRVRPSRCTWNIIFFLSIMGQGKTVYACRKNEACEKSSLTEHTTCHHQANIRLDLFLGAWILWNAVSDGYWGTQWAWWAANAAARFGIHSLQILSGSWNVGKAEVTMGLLTCGLTHSRSSLGVGMSIKQKWPWGARLVASLIADPLWELDC